MGRLRYVAAVLAVLLAAVALRLAVFHGPRDEKDRPADRAALHAARAAARTAAGLPQVPAAPPSVANAQPPAPAVETLSATERRFASAGLTSREQSAMKAAWPDWESRFASASDDMLKAHAARVKDFAPVVIPNEVSKASSLDVQRVVSESAARRAGGFGDDLAHAGGGALDDIARSGAGVADDVARAGGSMLDDVLRLLGLGGAAAAGGAAAMKRKK